MSSPVFLGDCTNFRRLAFTIVFELIGGCIIVHWLSGDVVSLCVY